MIRAVLFDLDGTLLDRETTVRRCIADQFARFADELEPVRMADFVAAFGKFDERGYVPKQEVYERMRLEFGFSMPVRDALISDYFQAYHRFCIGFQKMPETLEALRQQGLKLAIVTNAGTAFQCAATGALGIERFFDAIVISEAAGVRKPDRRIFELALARLGIHARDAVFVGDHPQTDIRGAQNAGMRAVWKRDSFWGDCLYADAVIDELEELPGVLNRF